MINSAGTEKTLTFKYVLIKTSVSSLGEKKKFIEIFKNGKKISIINATINAINKFLSIVFIISL